MGGTKLFYVDESGSAKTGWIVYSWIECAVEDWAAGLRTWLDLRQDLYDEHGIPASYELHASNFVSGRGDPSNRPSWNRVRHLRGRVVEQALGTIAESPVLAVGSGVRRTTARNFGAQMADAYRGPVDHLDRRLGADDQHGLMIVDGDGTARDRHLVHRELKLADRRVLEDPLFQPAHSSAWLQMADLVAYTTYQSLLRSPEKPFAWDW